LSPSASRFRSRRDLDDADARHLDQHDLAVRLHPGARDRGRRRDRHRGKRLHPHPGGEHPRIAAWKGTQEVSVVVIFGVLTT
jgi:hypothetical protein